MENWWMETLPPSMIFKGTRIFDTVVGEFRKNPE
jgi:hypothetical protein